MSKINIVLDASMLDTLQSCELKFDRRYNQNRVPPVTGKPLARGTIIHAGQEKYWEELAKGSDWPRAVDAGLLGARVALNYSDIDNLEEGNLYIDALEMSWNHYRIEDLGYQIEAVEQPFSYVLYEDETFRIMMIGKIDLVYSNNRYTNVPMDHKSFERDFGAKRFHNQFINYANALDSNFLFVNRIGVYAKTTKKKPEERFKRIPLTFDPAYVTWWKANTTKWALRYYENVNNKDWPANLTSCDKFNRDCEYLPVCDTSGEEGKIHKLEMYYAVTEPWDVSKSLRKASQIVKDVQEGKQDTRTTE